ncbi:MAG: tRNA (adenosine(37)-N6)-threonylcarbamoyltransferase complex ATPase subunit type 1 TsaE [Oscillospiraceae bacterium]|nr:tRNA (adenosine(37)-N6)-threonylcarbamoyltransferase complex ATPase subunit type 1 TsaE [Oscillospiraceae bacterium]
MVYYSHSEAETEAAGESLARALPEGGVVIALYGELGAGKTAFVRGLARGLEVDGQVVSPTFTIVNELYGKRDLFHFDMYRLGGADELFDIGWEDYLGRDGVCAVEWSENVPEAFDGSEIRVTIEKEGDTARKITVEGLREC